VITSFEVILNYKLYWSDNFVQSCSVEEIDMTERPAAIILFNAIPLEEMGRELKQETVGINP